MTLWKCCLSPTFNDSLDRPSLNTEKKKKSSLITIYKCFLVDSGLTLPVIVEITFFTSIKAHQFLFISTPSQ